MVIPSAEEMGEEELQQMADCLNDTQAAATRHINAMPLITLTLTAPPLEEEDIAAINSTPAQACQPLVRQQLDPRP